MKRNFPEPKMKFKKPPYFKPGTLVFMESGHELGISGKYYRCLKSTHRKCNANGERQINTETLERAFGRYATKFKLDKENVDRVANDLLKNSLWDVIVSTEEGNNRADVIMSATTEVMLQEAVENKRTLKSDERDFVEAYFKSQKADKPLMLCGLVLNFVKIAQYPEKEAAMGRNLALLTKKVYLSKEGKILELELEPWGWYAINFINRFVPNYLDTLKKSGVKLTNTPNEFLSMPIHEAAVKHGIVYPDELLGQDMRTTMELFKFLKDTITATFKFNPEQMALAIPLIFDRMQNDPSLKIAFEAMSLVGVKPEKISQSD